MSLCLYHLKVALFSLASSRSRSLLKDVPNLAKLIGLDALSSICDH